jgi:HemY protein
MKKIIYFLIVLSIAILAAYFVNNWISQYDNPGYVLMGLGHWSLETSLIVFLTAMALGFIVFYTFFRLLGSLFRLPGKIKSKGKNVKFNRSQEALISGLVDSAEGNWEKAEKTLIKHASNSGAPLLHYLTAARAAQSRGAIEKRDEYLRKATDQSGETDIAVGLTQAELHLDSNQFDQALEALTNLQSIDPKHASVLKMLHQTYHKIGDWEGMRTLIPSLHQNKVMLEAEVKLLESETFSRLLKQAAKQKDAKKIQELWIDIPSHIKSTQGITTIYFAALIEANAGATIEEEMANSIVKNWDETVLVIYGNVESDDYPKQLQTAEQWLSIHSNNAVLLRVLGKISIKCNQMEKAEQYLTKSVGIEPTVAAYQLLGDVLIKKGDTLKASESYKKGLELASSEIVSQVESISE